MTDFTLIQQRQQLEQTYNQAKVTYSLSHKVRQQIIHLWHQFRQFAVMSNEPRIWTETVGGETVYQVYDPVNHKSFTAQSEAELRTWLETRYYR